MTLLKRNIIAGDYSATWDGYDIGLVTGAYVLDIQDEAEEVTADQWGQTVIDEINQGFNCFLLFTVKEWTATTRSIMWPWSSTFGESAAFGHFHSSYAKQIVMTARTGSPADQTLGPQVVTLPHAIVSPNNPKRILFGNTTRDIPLVIRLYPFEESTNGPVRHFSIT